jgi:predicted RNase H-like nuclease (RuvC/YqgF family)
MSDIHFIFDTYGVAHTTNDLQEIERLNAMLDRQLTHSSALDDEIEKRDARIAELEDKLRHSDRKEIEACYRAMSKKDARIAELEKALTIARIAIASLDADALGFGEASDDMMRWPLRDELVDSLTSVLKE